MRVGVLTFHRAQNCGAVLQAYALQTVLRRAGHEVVFPSGMTTGYNSVWPECRGLAFHEKVRRLASWGWRIIKTRGACVISPWRFAQFRKKWLVEETWGKILHEKKPDVMIVGSDQVWNDRCASQSDFHLIMGNGLSADMPLVGYALSGGDRTYQPQDLQPLIYAATSRYRAVSFREPYFRDMVFPRGAIVCDPALFLDMSDYVRLASKYRLSRKPYIFLYAMSDISRSIDIGLHVAELLGLTLLVADPGVSVSRRHSLLRVIKGVSPDLFLSGIRYAEYCLVSSFHGCIFSILYHKRFVCLSGSDSGANAAVGRQQALLASLGLMRKRFPVDSPVELIMQELERDYDVSEKLDRMRGHSISFLAEVLKERHG